MAEELENIDGAQIRDGRVCDFFWFKNRTIDHGHLRRMGVTAWAVYSVLVRRADRRSKAFPSLLGLARVTGLSNRCIIDQLRKLAKLSYIRCLRRGGPGRGASEYLILSPPAISELGSLWDSEQRSPGASEPGSPSVVNVVHMSSEPGSLDIVNDVHTKQTHKKQTHTNKSSADKVSGPEKKFPEGVWQRAVDGWSTAWKATHRGLDYAFEGKDFAALSAILKSLKVDIDELKRVVRRYLIEPQVGVYKGHPLTMLRKDLNYFRSTSAPVGKGDGSGRPKGTEIERRDNADVIVEVKPLSRHDGAGAAAKADRLAA